MPVTGCRTGDFVMLDLRRADNSSIEHSNMRAAKKARRTALTTERARGTCNLCIARTRGARTKLRSIANAIGTNSSRPKYSIVTMITAGIAAATPFIRLLR
jgi:hypothetical protein